MAGLGPGEDEQRMRKPSEAVGFALDVTEEQVAVFRVLLRPALEDLDRAEHCRDRSSKLMGGVRDELSLALLLPLEAGDVLNRQGGGDDAADRVADRSGADLEEHPCPIVALEVKPLGGRRLPSQQSTRRRPIALRVGLAVQPNGRKA